MMLRLLWLAIMAGLLAGCRNGPQLGAPAPPIEQRADAVWPFWPAAMRIHPLTRLVEDETTGREIIEARVEFTDVHEHMSKAVGFLRIELFDAGNAVAEELSRWNIDLRDIPFNAQRFDDVSRTYLFRLRLEEDNMPEQPLLRAQFFSVNGTDLEAEHRVRR